MNVKNILKENSIKIIIGLKVILLLGILILIFDKPYIGDKNVIANEGASKSLSAKKLNSPAAKDDFVFEGEKRQKKRKSFLDALLYLPDINIKSLKKDEIGRYLTLIERKQSQVKDRLELLKKRENQLIGLEKNIDQKLKQLDEERKFFADTIQREKDLKSKRTMQLIQIYKKMDPKKAAPILAKLDKDLVVLLFNEIPQKQIMKILEAMTPDQSKKITEYYGRVSSGREYELLKELNKSLQKEFDQCKGMPEKEG